MDKIKLIVCLLILYSPSRSQSTVDFYRQYIPPLYRDSAQYQSAFAANLQNAEATDPELVYAFLVCFNAENGSFDVAQYQNYLKEASIKKEARRSWALSELRRLYSSRLGHPLKDLGRWYYLGMIDSDSANHTYEALRDYDINKRDFFVYRYYTRDSVTQYDPRSNYSEKRNAYESEVVDRYKNFCAQFTTDPDTTRCGRTGRRNTKILVYL